MDRRTALATVGAVVVVVVTGGAAIAANLGVLDDGGPEPAGQLQPADAQLQTIVVEPAIDTGAGGTPAARAAASRQTADSPSRSYADDDHGDDDHGDDARGGDDGGHDEEHEHAYEGADDDD